MTRLIRTMAVLEGCEEFVSDPSVSGGPLESYLVQHALVVLCADIQQEIYAIVRARASLIEDADIAGFISSTAQRVLRSVQKSELSGFVGHFGRDAKDRFNGLVDDAEVTRYNNAVSNRHDIAHHTGAQITFAELKLALAAAQNILQAVSTAIGNAEGEGAAG